MTSASSSDVNRNAPVFVSDEIAVTAAVDDVWEAHDELVMSSIASQPPELTQLLVRGPLSATSSRIVHDPAGAEGGEAVRLIASYRLADLAKLEVWSFLETGACTRITVEESWEGPDVVDEAARLQSLLAISLRTRLLDLKLAAENVRARRGRPVVPDAREERPISFSQREQQ